MEVHSLANGAYLCGQCKNGGSCARPMVKGGSPTGIRPSSPSPLIGTFPFEMCHQMEDDHCCNIYFDLVDLRESLSMG